MKIEQWNYLGPRSIPQEVRSLREASFDYHQNMGQPIIFKHRWNNRDVKNGLAQICPFHDIILGSDRQWDPYCFGTGFLGGWADGIITFVTIADSQEDRIRIGPQGVLLFETHPAFTAPWVPSMGDGDLIITAEFSLNQWDLIEEENRYVLEDITPRTMRGFEGRRKGSAGYRVHQEGNLDKLPQNHEWQTVPIVFDYDSVPIAPYPPVGGDPTDYPILEPGQTISSSEITIHVIGKDTGNSSFSEQVIMVEGLGNYSFSEQAIRVNNPEPGTGVYFNND